MSSLNKVMLIGNLGKAPDIRRTQSGDQIVNLSVATSVKWKDRHTKETLERTEWHRVVIFDDRLADIAGRYLSKGSKVYLEGELKTRKWSDSSGVERYTTEVVLPRYGGRLVMLDSKKDKHDQSLADEPDSLDESENEVPF